MILFWLILIPFLGGMLCWHSERWGEQAPRWIALATMLFVLAVSVVLWAGGDFSAYGTGERPWLLEWRVPWIPRFGIEIHLALDGLSLILIALTGFLGALAVLCSWKEIVERVGFFHLNLLFVLGGVVGVFLALDLLLFFLFWEVMLVPMYFLIALWGHSGSPGQTRIRAATRFFIYTQASGLLMLVAILALVFVHYTSSGEITFSYDALLNADVPDNLSFWIMLGFFIAFAVKLPVVPFHGWLPDAHAQAPTAGSVDLAGILLKTAAYGMLRFAIPLFPEQSQAFAPVAMALGVVGIIYGAVLACGQQDIKRLIAYASISHMGFVLIAVYSGSELAIQGAIVLMVAHAFSSAALFILSGQLFERIHTRDMRRMGGLWGRIPVLPGVTLLTSICQTRISRIVSSGWGSNLRSISGPPSTLSQHGGEAYYGLVAHADRRAHQLQPLMRFGPNDAREMFGVTGGLSTCSTLDDLQGWVDYDNPVFTSPSCWADELGRDPATALAFAEQTPLVYTTASLTFSEADAL